MSGSVAVTRAIAVPGLLLLLIIATALSLLIGAKSLPASVVLEALSGTCQVVEALSGTCQRRRSPAPARAPTAPLCSTPVCRAPLPVYWQAVRLALPGR